MRIASILRAGTLALALAASIASVGTAFAASENVAAQPQTQTSGNSGVYDGADFQAAKRAFN